MNGRDVKETMEQIHIPEKMQAEIITNLMKKQMESGKNKTVGGWKKLAATAAVTVFAVGIVGFSVYAVVENLVRARMAGLPAAEVQEIEAMVQGQRNVQADGFSREYSDEETERMTALELSYQNGLFPAKEILQVDSAEAITEGTLCYVKSTGVFYLPGRELTDEELLEIIDFHQKMRYAVEEGPMAQEARAEYLAEIDRMREEVRDADGISEEEAIEIARKQMEAALGENAAGMELLTDMNGCGAFLRDISDITYYEHERDVAYEVAFRNHEAHRAYICFIDPVDGTILYIP